VARDSEFEKLSAEQPPSILREFWDFMGHHKKWWLTPVLLMLLVLGILVVLGGTGAAPFIYTLF
jgi:hypothetical protein